MSGDTAMEHRFRWDEMDSSNNKYEWAVAAPSDEILRRMWTGWSVVSLTCGFFALAVFTGMISKRQVRENSFNVYVMAVSFPDFMPGILCGVDCVLRVMEGDAYTRNQCKFQAFYTSFNVVCNSWMNALICWEIHRLLRCSMRRERYFPPTVCNVLRNSGIVFLWSCITASLPLWPFDWVLLDVDYAAAGAGCFSSYYSKESELFFWFVAVPLMLGIPYVYVMCVAYDVYTKQLLPPRGYRKELAVYYFKIVFVVLFIWMPFLIFFVALRGRVHPWAVWTAGALAHAQTMISALLACQKHDIRNAVLEFWCCRKPRGEGDDDNGGKIPADKRKRLSIIKSVCHGDFPKQNSDFGFDGETDSSGIELNSEIVDSSQDFEQALPKLDAYNRDQSVLQVGEAEELQTRKQEIRLAKHVSFSDGNGT